jgi:hypothetical protein
MTMIDALTFAGLRLGLDGIRRPVDRDDPERTILDDHFVLLDRRDQEMPAVLIAMEYRCEQGDHGIAVDAATFMVPGTISLDDEIAGLRRLVLQPPQNGVDIERSAQLKASSTS